MGTSFSDMEFDPVTGQTKNKKPQQLPYLNPNEASQGFLPYTGNQQPATQNNTNVKKPSVPAVNTTGYTIDGSKLTQGQEISESDWNAKIENAKQQDALKSKLSPQLLTPDVSANNATSSPKQQMSTTDSLEQGNANVMGAAQNAALNQQNPQNNAIRQQAQTMTQGVMNNPSMGMDWAKYNTGQLSQYDANAALTAQKAKQELGGMGGSGQVQSNLINMMMKQNTGRSELDNTLQKETYQNQKADTYDALNQGLTTADSFDKSQTNSIDNLLKVRAGFEGERGQATANTQEMNVLDKTFGQDIAKLVKNQDWTGVQNQLDRESANALQSNDINAKKSIQERQIAADAEQLKNTQDFTGIQADIDRKMAIAEATKDRDLQNSLSLRQESLDKWKVDKQITADADTLNKTQNFTAVQNDIDRSWKSAESSQDRTLQNSIVERQLALDKWKQTNGQEFTADQAAINRALELTLKDKDATMQTNLLNLRGQIDKGLLADKNSFDAVQNGLDRKANEFAKIGDWKNATDITKLKGEIDAAYQQNQNYFERTEREASQSWQREERIETNESDKIMKTLDQKHDIAMQKGDITGTKEVEEMRALHQLKMQTQDMQQEEKMAYIKSELEKTMVDFDYGRKKDLLTFTHGQEIDKINKSQGFEKSMAYINSELETAIRNNDAVNSQVLQAKRLESEAIENGKNRVLQQASLDLEKQGVDMVKLDTEYERLKSLVDAGSLNPSVLNDFVQKTLKTAGIKLTPPDPQAARKEAQAKMKELESQFVITHPEYSYPQNTFDNKGNLLTIKPEGLKKFNEFYNSSVYGELTPEEKDAKKNAGKLGADDLQYGDVGDSFKIDAATTFNGQSIPPGEYKVINADYTKGSKFLGKKDDFTKRVLIDSNGKWIATIKDVKSGSDGNLVSNLWSQ